MTSNLVSQSKFVHSSGTSDVKIILTNPGSLNTELTNLIEINWAHLRWFHFPKTFPLAFKGMTKAPGAGTHTTASGHIEAPESLSLVDMGLAYFYFCGVNTCSNTSMFSTHSSHALPPFPYLHHLLLCAHHFSGQRFLLHSITRTFPLCIPLPPLLFFPHFSIMGFVCLSAPMLSCL